MKILSIFNRYRHYGGEETMMKRIADLLAEHGDSRNFIYSTKELLGHSVLSKCAAPFKSLHNTDVARQLEQMQKEHGFDAWLVHNVFPALSPSVFSTAYKLRVPVLFMMHNYRIGCINGSFRRNGNACFLCPEKNRWQGIRHRCWHNSILLSAYNTLFQQLTLKTGFLEKTTSFISVSPSQAPYLQRLGIPKEKTCIIPHFVDIPPAAAPPSGNGDILFMGRLDNEKGAGLLIDAWARIPHHGRTLIVAGSGPEEDNLKNRVARDGIADVEFVGFVSGDAQEQLWERASLYVMPSVLPETAAMTILEGWAHARPAIAFDTGAATDYLKDGRFGWLPDRIDAESLAHTLRQAMSLPEPDLQRMGLAAREHAAAHYSATVWLERFSTLCHSVISSPGNQS